MIIFETEMQHSIHRLTFINTLRFSFFISSWFVIFYILQLLGFFEGCYGIIPQKLAGLKGIITAPLMHADLGHLMGNVSSIFLLVWIMQLLYKSYFWSVFGIGWIFLGFLVWLTPEVHVGLFKISTCHIGASGLVYLMVSFIFFTGIFCKSRDCLSASLLIVALYGSLFWGIFPQEFFGIPFYLSKISWQSHAAGAITGLGFAIYYAKEIRKEYEIKTISPPLEDDENDEVIFDEDELLEEKKEDTNWKNYL